MAETLGTLTFNGVGGVQATPTFEDTINVINPQRPGATLSFTYSPTATLYSFVIGSTTYLPTDSQGNNYYSVYANNPITFTASVNLHDPQLRVIEYYWDFGDGTFGYGSPVAHTYTSGNMHGQVILRVTDNLTRHWYCRRPMFVQTLSAVRLTRGVVVQASA